MVIDKKRVLKGPPRYRRLYSRLGYLPGDVIARCPVILLNRKETRLIKKQRGGHIFLRLMAEVLFLPQNTARCAYQTICQLCNTTPALSMIRTNGTAEGFYRLFAHYQLLPEREFCVHRQCLSDRAVLKGGSLMLIMKLKDRPGKGWAFLLAGTLIRIVFQKKFLSLWHHRFTHHLLMTP